MPIDMSNVKFVDPLNLRDAAIFLGMNENNVRAAAQGGRITATKNEANQWQFKQADLTTFKNTPRRTGGGGKRGDGKMFIVRIKHTDLEAVKGALSKYGVELQPRYTYKPKSKKEVKASVPAPAPVARPSGGVNRP